MQADKRFVEGFALSEGLDAKAIDQEKGKRIMVEAMLRGSPIAKAESEASGDKSCILWTPTSRNVGGISACRSALSRDLGPRLEMLRGEIGRARFGFDLFRLLN